MATLNGKQDIINLIQQANQENSLKAFLNRMHEVCFDKCIQAPGSSLSRNEEACVSNCMRKYMNLHDTVGKEWNSHVQKMQASQIQY